MCNECDEPDDAYVPDAADPCGNPVGEPPARPEPDCDTPAVLPAALVATGSDADPCETDWLHQARHPKPGLPTEPGDPVVPPPVVTYASAGASLSRTRNNCPAGLVGSAVTVSVPPGAFTSRLSQFDADQLALAWLNSVAQLRANVLGTCGDNPASQPRLTALYWTQDSNCPGPATLTNLTWGWGGGITDQDCSLAVTRLSDLGWIGSSGCDSPEHLLFGLSWGNTTCA